MKKATLLLLSLTALVLNSCEEVIDVNLNTPNPKLVIEASINWYNDTDGNNQKIKLSTTANFYANQVPKVSGATVYIKNSQQVQFNFIEKPNTGEYLCTNFKPVIDDTYTLTIISNGETYTATETLKSVAPITERVQNNTGGITGKEKQIKVFFTDPANATNYYLFKYVYSNQVKSNYYADEDVFYNGNQFFSLSQNENLKTGDKIEVTHFGISKEYFNYMNILVSIAGDNGGGPFQSPPATVRGNIINTTQPDNYPLGYFALSEASKINYVVE
jgi:Domain of unknown function (DUF4249)